MWKQRTPFDWGVNDYGTHLDMVHLLQLEDVEMITHDGEKAWYVHNNYGIPVKYFIKKDFVCTHSQFYSARNAFLEGRVVGHVGAPSKVPPYIMQEVLEDFMERRRRGAIRSPAVMTSVV
jgi:hypothetical protein